MPRSPLQFAGAALAALILSSASHAIAQGAQYCWINAKTGVPVPVGDLYPGGSDRDPLDPNHATIGSHLTNEVPTQTFVREPDNTWTNSATGVPVPTDDLYPGGSDRDPLDPNHATIGSHLTNEVPTQTFVRVTCPEQPANSSAVKATPATSVLQNLLGHVSIGVGVGVGGDDRRDDRGR
jgi:hypothetical protein